MSRYPCSTPELDEAERRWWSDNGDLEEQFCWVQTPSVQRRLRGGYLRAVTDLVSPGASVLELGCGTGWFSVLLARHGVSNIVAVDFSAEQIARAREAAHRWGVSNRVRFEVSAGSAPGPWGNRTFDMVVMHAFLHHLSTAEITDALDRAAAHLSGSGVLVVVEPVHYPDAPSAEPLSLRSLRRLERSWRSLHAHGLRRMGSQEAAVRQRLSARNWADPPFGPSPKEAPFRTAELEAVLSRRFAVVNRQPCICMGHLVAQEILVASLSQPRLWRAVQTPVLALARALDAHLLRRGPAPSTVWVFNLYVCRKL